jgi:hypothetical protein
MIATPYKKVATDILVSDFPVYMNELIAIAEKEFSKSDPKNLRFHLREGKEGPVLVLKCGND